MSDAMTYGIKGRIWCAPLLALLLALHAGVVQALPLYAWQWPLELQSPGASAYQLPLSAEVYAAVQDAQLGDLVVIDTNDQFMPTAVLPAAMAPQEPEQLLAVPFFPLPPSTATEGQPRWRIRTETGPDQRIQRVETEILDSSLTSVPLTELLVDLSGLESPVIALQLDWSEAAPVEAGYRLAFSDDLQHWRPGPLGRLVDLGDSNQPVRQQRLQTGAAANARYLRLQALAPNQQLSFTQVQAVLAPKIVAPALHWMQVQGTASAEAELLVVHYQNPGRLPAQAVDVQLPANSAAIWWLESRDADIQPWRRRLAPSLLFYLQDPAGDSRSEPQALNTQVRDRDWRLVSAQASGVTPVLQLGYQPETLVFLAQGQPPYRLVAGSVSARRQAAPVAELLINQRSLRGEDWQPTRANLGAQEVLLGERALQLPAPTPDYRTWLLWMVLVLGALMVTLLALRVLRQAP